jgi:hypothetical protein
LKSTTKEICWDDKPLEPIGRPGCLTAARILIFAPIVAVLLALGAGRLNLAGSMLFGSPICGAAAGVLLSVHVNAANGTSKWWGIVFALVGALVCPILTFGGCVFLGRLAG